jgi:hypothetical protein
MALPHEQDNITPYAILLHNENIKRLGVRLEITPFYDRVSFSYPEQPLLQFLSINRDVPIAQGDLPKEVAFVVGPRTEIRIFNILGDPITEISGHKVNKNQHR